MYCKACDKEHGELYICESYSDELKEELKVKTEKYINDLKDPEWCQEQIDNGLPREAILIFKALAGVKEK